MTLRQTKTISITSGKGGVGKSTIVSNLAATLAEQGKRVLILDGDLGMANIDIMFGLRTFHSIQSVISGERDLVDIISPVSENIALIPGGSGIYGLSRLNAFERQHLLDQVGALSGQYDYMLIDTAPGIDDNVLSLNTAAQEIMVVITPDPASITDGYALIKVLAQRHRESRFGIITNLVRDEAEGMQTFRRISDVASKFLCVSLDFRGYLPIDPNLRQATRQQQLVVQAFPQSAASLGFRRIAEKLNNYSRVSELKGGLQFFWSQVSGVA